ncbi:hypothetical protein KW800_00395 [Candidatus Parcubacteria bacterium]|nr:hypothetical protein [Candidatus Parcubacteria bacterium]
MKVFLIQPRYPHGWKKPQTYLPATLMNLGSRLLNIGIEVGFTDLNHSTLEEHASALRMSDFIGFTILGMPYVSDVVQMIKDLRGQGFTQPMLVGGQGIARVEPAHFERWFGGLGAIQIKNDLDMAQACGINPASLQSHFDTSMVPMLKRLPDSELRKYLTSEFAIFTSQGCIFNCAFCSAAKGQKEQYRSLATFTEELEFVCGYLENIGHKELRLYLTNLDLFQTPEMLEVFLGRIKEITQLYDLTPRLRGLATSRFTFRAIQADSGLPKRARECGLECVAFGADGANEETWRRQNKRHNSLSELESICTSMQAAGITIELFMVMGFPDDKFRNLWPGVKFSLRQAMKGRVIRPYLAKQTPGGNWPQGDPIVEKFLSRPELLVRLDYSMIGSPHSHPNRVQRWLANSAYLAVIGSLVPFGKCPTTPLIPVPQGLGAGVAETLNKWMPFDR